MRRSIGGRAPPAAELLFPARSSNPPEAISSTRSSLSELVSMRELRTCGRPRCAPRAPPRSGRWTAGSPTGRGPSYTRATRPAFEPGRPGSRPVRGPPGPAPPPASAPGHWRRGPAHGPVPSEIATFGSRKKPSSWITVLPLTSDSSCLTAGKLRPRPPRRSRSGGRSGPPGTAQVDGVALVDDPDQKETTARTAPLHVRHELGAVLLRH